jgi:succinate-semialdehyde dehydrogenase / glutarate-semialdehyde dehydrogenase
VAQAAALARCANGGQSCIAAKRFLIHEQVYDEFLSAFRAAMRAVRAGDPHDASTELGPLISRSARDQLHRQVQDTIDAGANVVLGCEVPSGAGAFYPASIVTDIPDGTPMATDELFGPVAGVWRVRDLDDAVTRANSTRFGLGASVWTHDPEVAARLAAALECGSVMINQPVVSDPALPFGGVRASGYGRELGAAGLTAFANVKTIRGLSV